MKIFHTAISVKSLEESRTFYENVFGMTKTREGARPEIGVKFIMLEDDHGVGIELFEHTQPQPLTEDLMDFSKNGIKHIAFVVDDLDDIFAKAIKAGAKEIWPIKEGVTIKKLAFISDPNGIPIELSEL